MSQTERNPQCNILFELRWNFWRFESFQTVNRFALLVALFQLGSSPGSRSNWEHSDRFSSFKQSDEPDELVVLKHTRQKGTLKEIDMKQRCKNYSPCLSDSPSLSDRKLRSARAMASRSAPAWLDLPPPLTVHSRSTRPSMPVNWSGNISCSLRGREKKKKKMKKWPRDNKTGERMERGWMGRAGECAI